MDSTTQAAPQFLLGSEMGKLVCEAFGLPPERVRRIALRMPINDVATLEVDRILTDDEGCAITALLSRYHLCLAEPPVEMLLAVEPQPDGTLLADVTDIAEPYVKHAPLAPGARTARQRDVTRHNATEPKYLTIDPAAGRSQ